MTQYLLVKKLEKGESTEAVLLNITTHKGVGVSMDDEEYLQCFLEGAGANEASLSAVLEMLESMEFECSVEGASEQENIEWYGDMELK